MAFCKELGCSDEIFCLCVEKTKLMYLAFKLGKVCLCQRVRVGIVDEQVLCDKVHTGIRALRGEYGCDQQFICIFVFKEGIRFCAVFPIQDLEYFFCVL